MIEFEASYFFDKDKFDAKEEKAATSSNLREKRGKIDIQYLNPIPARFQKINARMRKSKILYMRGVIRK